MIALWLWSAGAQEAPCAPVDLGLSVPALLATTPPEPDAVGAEAWLALEARFQQGSACLALVDRRDLATLYLGAANVVSMSDPAERDRLLGEYLRRVPDAPRRFSLDVRLSPIGVIPTEETQRALAAMEVPGASAELTVRAPLWVDGVGLAPGAVIPLVPGPHLVQHVGRAGAATQVVDVEAGARWEARRGGASQAVRVAVGATGGALVAGGLAALVWGYGPAQRADEVDGDLDGRVSAFLGLGVGLAAVGATGMALSAAWGPGDEVVVRMTGRLP